MTTKNNEKVVVNAAENAELQCKFNGNPAPVTSWTNPNGLKLSDGDTLKFFETKQEVRQLDLFPRFHYSRAI